jgi:Uma2 family endonuclease
MAEPVVASPDVLTQPADRERFSLHEEEHVTERPSHRRQGTYTEFALRRLLPGWYVAGNMGVYWVPGEFEYPSVGPDVFVARSSPRRDDASVYLTYEDGPLTLVVEIASPSTRNMDRKKRDNDYAVELAVPWYLWIDLPRRVMELYQLADGRYELVLKDEQGQAWCPELGIGFAWDPMGDLVRVLARDRTPALTPDEEAKLREAAETRAESEARRAEREARRAEREAQQRTAAEQAAHAAQERAAALEAELDRLRRALEDR